MFANSIWKPAIKCISLCNMLTFASSAVTEYRSHNQSFICVTGGVPGFAPPLLPRDSRVSHELLYCDAGIHEKLGTEMDSGSPAPGAERRLYSSGNSS